MVAGVAATDSCSLEGGHDPLGTRGPIYTTRKRWQRALREYKPGLLDAANDNQPAGRPAPAKRELRLEALLEWTYRQQRAHVILREGMDWIRWAMDRAGYITNPLDHRKLHHDAALVHEAVLALGTEDAAAVIAAAMTGMWPEPLDDREPMPRPAEPADRYDDFGRHVRGDGTRFEYLIRTAEIVSIPKEEYELAGRKKMKRAKVTSYDKVPVRYCPIRWDPDPAFIEMENRRYAVWQAARAALIAALRNAPFRDHALAPDAPLCAANDNEAPAANDNDPVQAAMTV